MHTDPYRRSLRVPYPDGLPDNNIVYGQDVYSEVSAEFTGSSSPLPPSSPPLPSSPRDPSPGLEWGDVPDIPEQIPGDSAFNPGTWKEGLSKIRKAYAVLDAFDDLREFSIRDFFNILWTSNDDRIAHRRGQFWRHGGDEDLVKVVLSERRCRDRLDGWARDVVGERVEREFRDLTDLAYHGPHYQDARALRTPASSLVLENLEQFGLNDLGGRYERTMPVFQELLKRAIGKTVREDSAERNPVHARIAATSMMLMARSSQTNYFGTMLGFALYSANVNRGSVETLSRLGVVVSYRSIMRGMKALSQSIRKRIKEVANDPEIFTVLEYDNFNWTSKVHESSLRNQQVQHDQVSAILVCVPYDRSPGAPTARELLAVEGFNERIGRRLTLPYEEALAHVTPSFADFQELEASYKLMTARILATHIPELEFLLAEIPAHEDPAAMPPQVTKQYVCPTLDLNQNSISNQIKIIERYFGDVLDRPTSYHEKQKSPLGGDRLTTAQDRAATDRRAMDLSGTNEGRLLSYPLLPALLHACQAYIHVISKTHWGGAEDDPISLRSLRALLPHALNVKKEKIEIYAWIRFINTALDAHVLDAARVIKKYASLADFKKETWDLKKLLALADELVSRWCASPDNLEAEGIKRLSGETICGHSALFMRDGFALREMRHAIKFGHPSRYLRILRLWNPMYYAGKSYNYSSETAEFLHNVESDWPPETAKVMVRALVVNTSGRVDGNKELDMSNEHTNKDTKAKCEGSQATPELLEYISPCVPPCRELNRNIKNQVGVTSKNQRHATVDNHEDVLILADSMRKNNAHDFSKDRIVEEKVVDLVMTGLHQYSGLRGGHAKQQQRHAIRLKRLYKRTFSVQYEADQSVLNLEDDMDITGSADGATLEIAPGVQLVFADGSGIPDEDDEDDF